MHDAVGVIGIACPDESPLLSFVSLLAPAVARGNTVVIIPSEKYPLSVMDLCQVELSKFLLIINILFSSFLKIIQFLRVLCCIGINKSEDCFNF